jgi:hypothetical protein
VSHGAVLRGVEEGPQQSVLVRTGDRLVLVPWPGKAGASPMAELAGVGFGYPEPVGNIAEWVGESFAEHEDSAFGGRQPLQQEQDGVLDIRRPLGRQ